MLLHMLIALHYANKADLHDQTSGFVHSKSSHRHEEFVCALHCCVATCVCARCVSWAGIIYRMLVQVQSPVAR